MYKAVIFDFFDVVHADPQKAWLKDQGLTRSGQFAEASDKLDVGLINIDEYFELYAQAHGAKSAQQVRAEFKSYEKVDTQLVSIIKALRVAGYSTGLLSNTTSDEIKPILSKHNLEPLFNCIIISSEVGLRKPDPEIFKLMLEKLDVSPSETIFIDDSPPNVEAAQTIGITGIVHNNSNSTSDQLVKLAILT